MYHVIKTFFKTKTFCDVYYRLETDQKAFFIFGRAKMPMKMKFHLRLKTKQKRK